MTKEGSALKKSNTIERFDRLLRVIVTQPEPWEKSAKYNRTSGRVGAAGYGDTRTREGRSALSQLHWKRPPESPQAVPGN
jgi:hypothetical protein